MPQILRAEKLEEPIECQIVAEDQLWLSNFGVDPSWQDNPFVIADLNNLITLGSRRTNGTDHDFTREEIIQARERFFTFVGLEPRVGPTLVPIDTFVMTQRMMYELGLNAPKIFKEQPNAITFAEDTIRDKVNNLQSLDLEAVNIINLNPSALSYSEDSIRDKVNNLLSLGLDAIKVVNLNPRAISISEESVRARVANFISLGLDPIKVINTYPVALGYTTEAVEEKVRFLRRTAKVLGWENDSDDLIEEFAVVLGYKMERLRILRRIAAEKLPESTKSISTSRLKGALKVPIEKYMIAISDRPEQDSGEDNLIERSGHLIIAKTERKEKAKELALTGSLGRIGTMYLDYVEQAV